MKPLRIIRARRAVLALVAAIATLALAATSAAAFGPLGQQYGVGFPSGGGPGVVVRPVGIAIGADGRVIVSDLANNRIVAFDRVGRFLFGAGKNVSSANPGTGAEVCTTDCQPGESGSGAGELGTPWGVAASADAIYVADQSNFRVSVFDYQGHFLRAFGNDVGGPGVDVCATVCGAGTPGPDAGSLTGAFDIGLRGDRLFVTTVGTNRIEVFNAAAGSFAFAFGKNVGGAGVNTCTATCQSGVGDAGPGSVTAAYALAVGPGGEVYTAGPADGKVSVFDVSGAYLRQFGGPGEGAGQFSVPYGIAVDDAGMVYVVDVDIDRLSVFGPGGDFRAAYGRNVIPGLPGGAEVCTIVCGPGEDGFGVGEFSAPYGIAVDCRGSIYTATQGRVEKWGEPGVAAPPCPPPAPPASTPAPLAKPSNAIKLGKLKLNRKRGTATLMVTVPGAGTMKAAAGKKMKAMAPKPKGAGTLKLRIGAKGKGLRALNRTGKLKGKLRLTFQPTGGDTRTVTRKLTLIKTGYSRGASADSKRR